MIKMLIGNTSLSRSLDRKFCCAGYRQFSTTSPESLKKAEKYVE